MENTLENKLLTFADKKDIINELDSLLQTITTHKITQEVNLLDEINCLWNVRNFINETLPENQL